MNKPVLITILNYNNPQDTLLCLKSLRQYLPRDLADILLVENSKRPSGAGKELADFYRVVPNKGYSHGNNVGLRMAQKNEYPYVLLLNNDIICGYDFLSNSLEIMRKEKFAAASPKIILANHEGSKIAPLSQLSFAGAYAPKKLEHWYPRGAFQDGQDITAFSKVESSDWLSGACLIIETKYLKTVGLLDQDYFLYYEDVDWCVRAKKHGLMLGYIGAEYLYHQQSKSTSHVKRFYYPRAFILFIKKHFPEEFHLALKRFLWHYLWPHIKNCQIGAVWNDIKILGSIFLFSILKRT